MLRQHDAACRVIARLKKERDEARSLLAQAERYAPTSTLATVNAPAVSNGRAGSFFSLDVFYLVYKSTLAYDSWDFVDSCLQHLLPRWVPVDRQYILEYQLQCLMSLLNAMQLFHSNGKNARYCIFLGITIICLSV